MIKRYQYVGQHHTRCRISADSGDSVKVVEGEVVTVDIGSHKELTEKYFVAHGFVEVVEAEAPSAKVEAAEGPVTEEPVAEAVEAQPETEAPKKGKKSKK